LFKPNHFDRSLPMQITNSPQAYLDQALDSLALGRSRRRAVLDALPVPVYITDPDGLVTYWNRACIDFAGREPQLGKDRWCVTWRIHTMEDEPLPHDRCPMAVAVKEGRTIRGEIAIAERPDGTRKAFVPYPTPLFGEDGQLIGAINLLIDVSEEQGEALACQAARCRRLADATSDRNVSGMLDRMAEGYDLNAAAVRPTGILVTKLDD
jgi:PAS domain-containing protein